ncbi:MAG: hypothetical protein ACK2UT_18970, partial [Candidatus Promineifilaceae bacterium]
MFEVDGNYANRKGNYTVLTINGPSMTVRYEDGTTADLHMGIQERIWENILAEREQQSKRSHKKTRRRSSPTAYKHFIKVVNVTPGEELTFPGWEERVVMAPGEEIANTIKKGDRLIYFTQDGLAFFAVATVTGDAFTANPKKYTFTVPENEATFFQIDIDADTGSLDRALTLDSVELESCPDFSLAPAESEMFCPISEDDFELL